MSILMSSDVTLKDNYGLNANANEPEVHAQTRSVAFAGPAEEIMEPVMAHSNHPGSSSMGSAKDDLAQARAKRNGILSIKRTPPTSGERNRFGSPNCAIGTMFKSRKACSAARVHAPNSAGISHITSQKSPARGVYSIVLNGGYEDDLDLGYTIYYTGAGGQADNRAGSGKQVKDQSMKHHSNSAFRYNKHYDDPVRVVRGYKSKSPWSPLEGFRYDGLYKVTECAVVTGASGHDVCRFTLKRLPGQVPLEELPRRLA